MLNPKTLLPLLALASSPALAQDGVQDPFEAPVHKPKGGKNSLKRTIACLGLDVKPKEYEIQREETRSAIEAAIAMGSEYVTIGKEDLPVVRLQDLLSSPDEYSISPEAYFNYLASITERPDDVHRLINEPNLRWAKFKNENDQLFPPDVIMDRGGGDCDNLSWFAKEAIDVLSCRTGIDFAPRVIASGTHAITIYRDYVTEDWNSIDQGHHALSFGPIHQASILFDEGKGYSQVALSEDATMSMQFSVDPERLNKNYLILGVNVYKPYPGDELDVSAYAPRDWKLYELFELRFSDGTMIFYKMGELFQKTTSDKQSYHYENSKLVQIDFPDGSIGLINEETGKMDQIQHANGQTDFLDEAGKMIQRNFSDGHREHYDPETGAVLQYSYLNKEESSYQTVWVDEKGVIIQTKSWEGKIKNLQNQ